MTEAPREELTVDKLERALTARTGGRLDRASGEALAESLDEAGLGDVDVSIAREALAFVVWRWKRRLLDWEPTDAERARPH